MGSLYIVATPIGNLDDITLRAIDVLRSADYVVCEDSRRTGILLHNFEFRVSSFDSNSNDLNINSKKIDSKLHLRQQMITIHEHSKDEKIYWLIGELKSGKSVALVTDAGTPGIADPGGRVVEKAVEAGIDVVPIPGPSSLSAILSITGWQNEPVLFVGYLPKKKGRQTLLKEFSIFNSQFSIKSQTQNSKFKIDSKLEIRNSKLFKTIVLFESPFRINKTISELAQYLGADCQVVIGRELTKQFETTYRGTLGEMAKQELPAKGEYVVAVRLI